METVETSTYAAGLLKTELAQRKERNPRYSLRSFAKNLGMSPAQLSQLISGKRNFNPESLRQIAVHLRLSPEQENILFSRTLIPRKFNISDEPQRRRLAEDEFRTIADWYHFAILSLSKLRGAKADPFWIADRLGITPTQAREALERLVRLQIIEEGKNLKQKTAPLNVVSEVSSAAIQTYHHSILNLAKDKLDSTPPQRRDYSAVTFAVDPEKIGEARKMIEEFQDRLTDFLENPHAKEVFVLSCQFFPLERK